MQNQTSQKHGIPRGDNENFLRFSVQWEIILCGCLSGAHVIRDVLWFTRPTAPTRNPQRHSCDSITSDRRKVRKAFPRWLPQSLFSSSSFALTIYHPVHLDRLQFPGGVSLLSTGVSGAPGSPQGQWEGRGLVRPPDLSQGDGSVGPTAGLMSCLTGQTIDVRQIDGCAIKHISKLGNLSNITVNTMDILYYISLKAVSL